METSIIERASDLVSPPLACDAGAFFRLTAAWTPAPPPSVARVLVVTHAPARGRLLQTILVNCFPCAVDAAADALDALEHLAEQRYDLVISELRLPQMSGTELYLWLREAQPAMGGRFILVLASGERVLPDDEIPDADIPVLAAPFGVAQVCDLAAPFLEAGASGFGRSA